MAFISLEAISDVIPYPVLVALISVSLVSLYYVFKNRNLPPGPKGLPLVGIWPFLDVQSTHLQLQSFQKKYGDIMSFSNLGHLYINLGSFKVLREAYITKAECFGQKYEGFSTLGYVFGGGVFFISGEHWKLLRKFFVQLFKEYGMTSSKNYMAGPIYDTLDSMLQELHAKKSERFNVVDLLIKKCSITIRSILFKDCGISKEEIEEFNRVYGDAIVAMGSMGVLMTGEIARRFVFPTKKYHDQLVETNKAMADILQDIIRRHESTFDDDNIRDMIDSYLKERKDRKKKGDPTAKYFTDQALISTLIQFIGDGVHTLSVVIFAFIQTLIEHPEEQEKIYNELIEVIGSDRQPTLEDRGKLPYANAFLNEVMRLTSVMPFLPSLECTKETTVGGYRIPKGAITIVNIWTIHHDPAVYDEPDKFDPSRFLSRGGKSKSELPILFGVGKRSCIGEGYTMTQVFLFIITLIRNFRLTLPEGERSKAVLYFNPENPEICVHPRVNK